MFIDILCTVIVSAVVTVLIITGIYIIAEKVIEYISRKRGNKND